MESKEFKALKEQLLSCRRNGFDRMDAAERSAMESYCTDYKAFLDTSKTERLCAGRLSAWQSRPATGPMSEARR